MKKTFGGKWRYDLVFALLMLALVALGARLGLLMRYDREKAVSYWRRQQRVSAPLPARVGTIRASTRGRYVLLAASKEVPLCFIDPAMFENDADLAETVIQVATVLNEDPVSIQNEVLRQRWGRYVPIKRGLAAKDISALRALGLPGVGISREWRRTYPNGDLAATVVGFRRRDGVPGGGLESSLQRHLRAVPGKRVALADARRRAIWPLPDESSTPVDGSNVFLCLDAVIQRYLQQAVLASVDKFKAKWGTGIVVDPHTGEILAMCSVPTFDPNNYSDVADDQRTNRVVCVPFEPGSVAKPIFAAAAVDAGVVSYATRIFCENGTYHALRGGQIGDHGSSYGHITVAHGVIKSSNILMAKLGELLGNDRLHEIAYRFGFGRCTGLGLPGESGGIVRPLGKWDGYSLRRVPFGQEISCTTLQLAMAFSALANGGLLLRPRLIDKITDPNGRVIWSGEREVVRRVIKPGVAAETLGVMQEVVERGTGKNCRLDNWTSFGKTGTAQIAGRGGYVSGAYTGSFVGGAPASWPRAICLISIYWPKAGKYYGGTVAAPYVKDVLQKTLTYLNVPHDRQPRVAGRRRGRGR